MTAPWLYDQPSANVFRDLRRLMHFSVEWKSVTKYMIQSVEVTWIIGKAEYMDMRMKPVRLTGNAVPLRMKFGYQQE